MIYCVEDDSSIRELMLYALRASGFQAEGFETAAPFWKALEAEKPELILLDIMLPDEDGISILKKLRRFSKWAQLPVIMATAKGTEFDKVTGLDLGADDYLAKPFGMMEMVSRIRAVLRRCEARMPMEVLTGGGVLLDEKAHKVYCGQNEIDLTLKEYTLLQLFMSHSARAFTREELLNLVWGGDFVGETRTVDVHIASLRMKLGAEGEQIRTVRGVGYRWEARK